MRREVLDSLSRQLTISELLFNRIILVAGLRRGSKDETIKARYQISGSCCNPGKTQYELVHDISSSDSENGLYLNIF